MPLDDDATLVPAVGHYYWAPTVGQAKPTTPLAPDTPYVDLGHTSLSDPFGITSDGGDSTTQGTWQNRNLRVTYAQRVESVAFQLMQWDATTYPLYWGGNATVDTDGWVQAPQSPVPTEGTLYVLVTDGADHLAMYFPHVSIYRADDIALDADNLSGLPVAATVLGVSGQDWLYAISPKGDLTPVGG